MCKKTGERLTVTWEKMSKSKYNGVNPDKLLNRYGVDTTRLVLLNELVPWCDAEWNEDREFVFLLFSIEIVHEHVKTVDTYFFWRFVGLSPYNTPLPPPWMKMLPFESMFQYFKFDCVSSLNKIFCTFHIFYVQ